jgi:hypothetical protein
MCEWLGHGALLPYLWSNAVGVRGSGTVRLRQRISPHKFVTHLINEANLAEAL